MRTADGVPLKISLQRALVRSRIRALLLVVPLLAFIAVAFVLPIGDMLFRSVDNRIVASILPRTAVAIQDWNPNGTELPDEAVFEALTLDIKAGVTARTLGRVARRLNYEKPGMTSLFRKTGRRTKRVAGPPYKERILEIDGRWRDLNTWRLIRREAGALTSGYFLASVDLKTDDRGEVVWQSEERRIYLILFFRTLWMSALITVLCLLLGYPVAYLLAHAAAAYQQSADDPRPAAVLDVPAGADDVLDRAAADGRSPERCAGLYRADIGRRPASTDSQPVRHLRGDGPHPAAVHDPAALLGDEDDPPVPDAGRPFARGDAVYRVRQGLHAQYGLWGRGRLHHGVHPFHRLLHHTRAGRRADRHVHIQFHSRACERDPELGARRGAGLASCWRWSWRFTCSTTASSASTT